MTGGMIRTKRFSTNEGSSTMGRQRSKSDLFSKLGSKGKKAFEEHKGDTTEFDGGGNLPAGIEGGIAQLVDCKFDVYKKGNDVGEYYFYAAGIVKTPVEHDGASIEGLRTTIMEPLCDTPNRSRPDVRSHLGWILNELRKLGVNTDELDPENYATEMESVAQVLEKEQPYFRFRTWKGEKQTTGDYAGKEPRTNHVWNGECEYIDGDEVDDVADATGDNDEDEDEEEENTSTDNEDLEALGSIADEDDESDQTELSQFRLTQLAEAAELDPDDYATWTELATALENAEGKEVDDDTPFEDDDSEEDDEEEGEDDEEGEEAPVVGEVYLFKPPKARKRVECEVTAVFEGKETCNVKTIDTKKTYKAVPWDNLNEE